MTTKSPRLEHPTPSKLNCLFLPGPAIVLPALQVSLPIDNALVQPILRLIKDNEYPMIGVFPIGTNEATPFEWGCAARVVRVARPAAFSPSPKPQYNLTLQGLTRIRIADKAPAESAPPANGGGSGSQSPANVSSALVELAISYPSIESQLESPSKEVVHAFRAAAFRLLDRLDLEPAADPTTTASRMRPDVYRRLRSLAQDINADGAVWLADIIMGVVVADWEDKLAFLAVADIEGRLRKATEIFNKRSDISEVATKISQDVGESLSKQQKEFFLRQQLQAIQRELARLTRGKTSNGSSKNSQSGASGTNSPAPDLDDEQEDADDLADLRKKIELMVEGSEERKMAAREWKRLKRIPAGSVENGVIRNYLEWLTAIPWPGMAQGSDAAKQALLDPSFLPNARSQLENDHYGLDAIKRRLIEYLAVVRLKTIQADKEAELEKTVSASSTDPSKRSSSKVKAPPSKGPILLLVGPPGCGKTSVAQSVAKALQRPFQRISLGGVRDEAEIRGHRRTYVASSPGSIVQALRRAGQPDMVLLLDEIDKVGHNNFHGDPSAALLEVLDPEQNHTFNDHYMNVPIDLSQTLFIATANSLDTISGPLLDRCEVIRLSGYTYDEKMHIAKRYLIPKQLKANGLPRDQFEITDSALQHVASRYTREAGVRTLERQIGSVVRYKAVQWADSQGHTGNERIGLTSVAGAEPIPNEYHRLVDVNDLEEILGIEWWDPEERDRVGRKGVVNGLVVQGEGEGGILAVETILVPGTGKLKLTGSLGDVIRESGELALTWVKANAFALGITSSPTEDPLLIPDGIDVHLHLPAGAQKKDGPSAGIAMICAFVSLLTGAIVPSNVAMTGEITLRGHVTPIGGVKEKVLGAHRAGIRKVILPSRNRRNFEHELDKHPLREEMDVIFVSTVKEGLEAAFGKGVLRWRTDPAFLAESRL